MLALGDPARDGKRLRTLRFWRTPRGVSHRRLLRPSAATTEAALTESPCVDRYGGDHRFRFTGRGEPSPCALFIRNAICDRGCRCPCVQAAFTQRNPERANTSSLADHQIGHHPGPFLAESTADAGPGEVGATQSGEALFRLAGSATIPPPTTCSRSRPHGSVASLRTSSRRTVIQAGIELHGRHMRRNGRSADWVATRGRLDGAIPFSRRGTRHANEADPTRRSQHREANSHSKTTLVSGRRDRV